MALQTSGPISLDDIHVEAGGTTGTQAGINDTDIRNLIGKSSATQMGFNEWYGAAAGPTLKYTMAGTQIQAQTSGKGATAAFVLFYSSTALAAAQAFVTPSSASGVGGFMIRDFLMYKNGSPALNNNGNQYYEGVVLCGPQNLGIFSVASPVAPVNIQFRYPSVADNYFIAKYNGVPVVGPTDDHFRTTNQNNPGLYMSDTSLTFAAGYTGVSTRQTLSAWSLEYYSI